MEQVPLWKKLLGAVVALWIVVSVVSVWGDQVDCGDSSNSGLYECAPEEETSSESGLCEGYSDEASFTYCMESQYDGGDFPAP